MPIHKRDASQRIFLRLVLNNLLILAVTLVVSIVYYGISIRVVRDDIDSLTLGQLRQSIKAVDTQILELDKMMIQFDNDYDFNYYLSTDGPFTDSEYYNLKRISEKLAPYVHGNPILNHLMLYLNRSNIIVSESGFGHYDEFYGTVFAVEGYTAAQWKAFFFDVQNQSDFYRSLHVSVAGEISLTHVYSRSIGYGDYLLGSVVFMIEDAKLQAMMAAIPQEYGGWVYVTDSEGRFITATGQDIDEREFWRLNADRADSFVRDGQRFRLYRMTSQLTGWNVTAALNETQIFSEVRAVRDAALGLFAVALVLGTLASYFVAFRNSRPWKHITELVRPDLLEGPGLDVYDELEEAVAVMANRNKRLEAEIQTAAKITRSHFFQNLLRGYYQSREDFHRDAKLFDVAFSAASYYLIVCRVSHLYTARADASFARLREALDMAILRALAPGDFQAAVSFDDVAIVRRLDAPTDLREDAIDLVGRIRGGLDPQLRKDFSFGVGTRSRDPFLLAISFNQALSANSPVEALDREYLQFYDEAANAAGYYSYPLDVEESLMRAVRSGNREMVSTLLAEVRAENFERRNLSLEECESLFVELKGTALKLFNALPGADKRPSSEFEQWCALSAGVRKLGLYEALCLSLADKFDGSKKSHNSALLSAVQRYLETRYGDQNLSLTEIADELNRSENYLSHFFKEQTGTKLSDALAKIRMEKARELLGEGFLTIDQVAVQCGYGNTGSFRRAFKRYFGLSPSDFRARDRQPQR